MTIPTYGHDRHRLLSQHVSADHVGGFLTWDRATRTETLFAVDPRTGKAVSRTDRIGCAEFDGTGWMPCETVPAEAEWIGNYPAPKARAALQPDRRA